jgi:hypothetical protein
MGAALEHERLKAARQEVGGSGKPDRAGAYHNNGKPRTVHRAASL